MPLYSVSQIARRTGVTVRTLHHYEACELLIPATRTPSGYRQYGERELRRLQHIVSLRTLGFSLDDIRGCLDSDAPSLAMALAGQVERLRAVVDRQQALLLRIEAIALRAANGEAIDAESLINSIEASTIMENHLTPEQMQAVRRRGEQLGPARIREVEQAWPDVIAGMQAALALDKDPASPDVAALARRWRSLLREFTGGDDGIRQSLNTMFREEPTVMQRNTGIDPATMAYACRAIAALPAESPPA